MSHLRRSQGFAIVPVISTAITLLGTSPQAQADADLFFSDLPIVASVSRLPQRRADLPSAVTILDRATIRASGARSLSDLFRLVPGFQTFAQSDIPARVNYHGIADDQDYSPRVQVLVDGRSLHSPLFRGGVNWALIPVALEDIDRIEVVRGSNTVSYGTNAFLGVINIITLDPALTQGTSVSLNRGSQGVEDYTLRTSAALGEDGRIRLTYQQIRDDGLDHRLAPPDEQDWRDSNLSRMLDLRASYQLGISDLLEVHLGGIQGTRLVGRLDEDTGLPRSTNPLRDIDEESLWFQTRWLRTFSSDSDFSLRYTYSQDSADAAFDHPTRLPGYNRVDTYGDRGSRHEIEAVHTFLPFADTRFVWGASWRHDAIRSQTLLQDSGDVSRDIARVFANTEWRPAQWFTGNLGLSYEYDQFAGKHLAPRASANFHLTPEHTVRVGYARAWRTPSTIDFKANYWSSPTKQELVGNPDLPAERLDSWELGYLGKWPTLGMQIDVRMFREKVSDRLMNQIRVPPDLAIDSVPTPNSTQDVQNIRIRGYELQWIWRPLQDTRITLNHANIRLSSEDNANGRRLLANPSTNYAGRYARYTALAEQSAPRRSTSIMLQQGLPFGLDLSVMHYRVGEVKWSRNTDVEEKYNRTDLRLAYPFSIGPQRGEIAYTVQSLTGEHFEQRMERVVDKRHWVSLRMDF